MEEVASYTLKRGHKGQEGEDCEKSQEIVTCFIPDEPWHVMKTIYG